MLKISCFLVLFGISTTLMAQPAGRVNKKTREFTVPSNLKFDYQIFGYQYANNTTPKMICFSSHQGDIITFASAPLGAYFDSYKMKPADKILYLGPIGSFAKMNYVSGTGKTTTFYIPKSSFTIQ